ncbi:unnamed protein product [Symbiodinium sp. CCMP2592]|nr:unnamed protein product [Symbiodinium sp. CCMP2592]
MVPADAGSSRRQHALVTICLLAVAEASCSGGILCDGTTKSDCEFFSSCTWSSGSSSSTTCTGLSSFCSGQTTQRDCEFWNCNWGSGSSSGGGSTGGNSGPFNPCSTKISDGNYCVGDTLITCANRGVTRSQYCSAGDCSDTGLGNAVCGNRLFCSAKISGSYCDGRYLKVCSSSSVTSTQDCREAGCDEFTPGRASCGSANFCTAKLDGDYCDGEVIKRCPSGEVVEICRGNTCSEQLRSAACGDVRFCLAKPSGRFCDGSYMKTCGAGESTGSVYCGTTCSDAGVNEAECGTPRFCQSKLQGSYCDGRVLKACGSGNAPVSQSYCDGGCAEWSIGVAGCGAADAASGGGLSGLAAPMAAVTPALALLLSPAWLLF